MSKKLIAVVGVTGAQGGSVARTFLTYPDWSVRGITRNPSSESAQKLSKAGVEIVQGDLDDKDSLIKAFEGAHTIFSNTDFFLPFFTALQSGQYDALSAAQAAYKTEVEQGVNTIAAASSPSVLRTLERFILSSLSHASKASKGKFTKLYHFDSKAEMERVARGSYPDVAARLSTVALGHYTSNWKLMPKMAIEKQDDGSVVISRPFAPDYMTPWVVADQDTGPFVKALVDLPVGTNIAAISEYMTHADFAALWGRIMGVKCVYKQASYDEFWAGQFEVMKVEVGDSFDYAEEFGFFGQDGKFLEAEQLGVKVKTTSMEEYIKMEDWSSVLNA